MHITRMSMTITAHWNLGYKRSCWKQCGITENGTESEEPEEDRSEEDGSEEDG